METISMNVVPFKFHSGGFYDLVFEGRGLLKDEGDYLTLEFQQQDLWFGIIKSAIQSIRVPVNEVSLTRTYQRLAGSLFADVPPDAADDEHPTSRRPARGQPRASAAKDQRARTSKQQNALWKTSTTGTKI